MENSQTQDKLFFSSDTVSVVISAIFFMFEENIFMFISLQRCEKNNA